MTNDKTALTPENIARPFGAYNHGIAVPEGLIVTSGQLGLAKDETCPADVSAQARICLDNIDAVLASAGANRSHILRLNAYVTRRDDFPHYMSVRDAWLADVPIKPASTLMIVSGFTRPEFLVEIEAMAWCPWRTESAGSDQ